jgi:CcmD family protein
MNRLLLLILFSLISLKLSAQDDIPMADLMRSNGKIYVVVGVLVIIFVGIVLYLLSIERRLKKLEKEE